MRDHDLTDEEIAAIKAESEAYDRAHPRWREEAEARRAAWRKDTMPAGHKAMKRLTIDPELKQRIAALGERLLKKR